MRRGECGELWSGLRREFFCRMKIKSGFDLNSMTEKRAQLKYEKCKAAKGGTMLSRYTIIHCVGYICIGSHQLASSGGLGALKVDDRNQAHHHQQPPFLHANQLVLICRLISKEEKNQRLHFLFRLSVDGKFTFVDNRVAMILGICRFEHCSIINLFLINGFY